MTEPEVPPKAPKEEEGVKKPATQSARVGPQPEAPDLASGYLVVHERQKSIRWIAICIGVCFCFWVLASSVVKVLEKDKNPWLVMGLSLVGPSGIIVTLIKVWHTYLRKTQKRVKQLEKQVDPKRTSSGLEENGDSKYGL